MEEYIRSQLAISYDDFYSRGKERLPDDVFREMTQRIRMIQPNAEVIVAGISNNSPEIYFTDSEWTVRAAHDFAVVGEGENLAVASLLRREQHAWNPLLTTLYNVFEAKKNCHTVPSVGTKTFLAVLTQGEYRMVSLALERHLDQRYRAYNPPVEKDDLKFDGEYYFRNEQEG